MVLSPCEERDETALCGPRAVCGGCPRLPRPTAQKAKRPRGHTSRAFENVRELQLQPFPTLAPGVVAPSSPDLLRRQSGIPRGDGVEQLLHSAAAGAAPSRRPRVRGHVVDRRGAPAYTLDDRALAHLVAG